ncbi:WXG100 family type VII secretion target [Paenibacillus xylaniclasticus]|uniref:WXG100 family type VII secretion target n=1 Tax=Paenibacillus xylaniclasticus TaxID=588083 RepID=UPI000FDABB95|nr:MULTISPECIES: WXG100 family type VII secretion target [Paenibacillus]GFN30950.1 hypothetical protein PCURB6_12100 [Paenibacillus curdlanolyticus]
MAKRIKVDPSQLETAAGKIRDQATEYQKLYNQLYNDVAHMGNAWKGEDNRAYTQQIDGFKDDLENMKRLMDEFARFLTESAKAYKDTQAAIVQAAGKLAN